MGVLAHITTKLRKTLPIFLRITKEINILTHLVEEFSIESSMLIYLESEKQ